MLINNAGIMHIGPMLEEPESSARRIMEINVLGVMTGMKLALPGMIKRGHGHVVNIASVAGKSPVPGGASYAASKAAVVSLTETARVEFRGQGVDFTCVMPSFTATDLIAGTKGTRFVATIKPGDVAAAIAAAVAEPRYDVYVPKSVGAIIKLNSLLGRKVRDGMARALKADRTFLDFDHGQRAAYEARISPRARRRRRPSRATCRRADRRSGALGAQPVVGRRVDAGPAVVPADPVLRARAAAHDLLDHAVAARVSELSRDRRAACGSAVGYDAVADIERHCCGS